jgi:hypothetical protein
MANIVVDVDQTSLNAEEAGLAKEKETKKGSQRIKVTAWQDSNTAIEFLVPEWFIASFDYSFDKQNETLKKLKTEKETPAPAAANNAKLASGLKVKGGTKIVGAKITLPVEKTVGGKQGENFGKITGVKKGAKTFDIKKRGFRLPGKMANLAIQYWLYTCCALKPEYFIRGSYQFPVSSLKAAPSINALGTAYKSKSKG